MAIYTFTAKSNVVIYNQYLYLWMISALSFYLRSRWFLLLVLLVFICLKIPHLFYPFYCDEGWVYAPAVKTMAINGPSLMPGAIPEMYSRGHPLLFHFLCGVWIKIFGASDAAVRSFPLFVTVLFLIGLFEGSLRLFGKRVAVLVLLLVTTQIIFFVQASFVYPEMLLAALTFFSLYYYSRDQLLLTSVMMSMLFLTKESGLLFGAVIGGHAFVSLFSNKDSVRLRLLRLVSVGVPFVVIGVFFVVQKQKLGWYLLPEHAGMINTGWKSFYFMFREALHWTFWGDKASYVLVYFVIVLSFVAAVLKKNVGYMFLAPPAGIVYILSNKGIIDNSGEVIWVVLFVVFFAGAVYGLLTFEKTLAKTARCFILLLGISVMAYIFYASLSQVAYRYNLVAIVLVMIFLAVCISLFIDLVGKNLYPVAIGGILLVGIFAVFTDGGNNDTDLEAFHAINVQVKEVAFLEKENAYDKNIAIGCYWEGVHLTDTLEGFLSSNHVFTKVAHYPVAPNADYAVFDNICGSDPDYDRMVIDSNFHLVFKIHDSKSWAEIYKHNDTGRPFKRGN
jgi:Dolichyl-phosphate-mannose-protein mannosyltransferase